MKRNGKPSFFKRSIQWKFLLGMIGLVISVMSISTFIQIQSQKTLLHSELSHRIGFVKDSLVERGSTMSYHLALQAEDALSSYNLYSFIRQVEKAVTDNPDFKYAIVMDSKGTAHIHTRHPERQETVLTNEEDVYALQVQQFTMNEFVRDSHQYLEFITPLTVGMNVWGVLRLGYSLDNLNQMISGFQETINHQTQKMVWRSVLVAGVFILITAVILSVYARRFIEPLTELAGFARAVSRGQFSDAERIEVNSEDEVGVLAKAFKDMAGQLEISYRQLRDYGRILEKKVAERTAELVDARDQALSATRAKSDFLASMSHEIRTPLNAILGMADLLKESRLSTEQRKYVQVFQSSGETLLALINDILDLSRVEAGRIELESISFNLQDLAQDCCEMMALKVHEKGLDLILRIDPATPMILTGDPGRFRQVLMNLMGNALKFTEEGEIFVTISPVENIESKEADLVLEVSIKDTGIGIDRAKQSIIFEPFGQADISISRIHGGTGLGLSICQRLVTLMGGTIQVHSELGLGSTFTFTVCFIDHTMDKDMAESENPLLSLTTRRILVFDDSQHTRDMLTERLEVWGAGVQAVKTGTSGFSALEKAVREKTPFDTVLLEAAMQAPDGFTLAKMIGDQCDPIPRQILMLTTVNAGEQIRKAKEIGVTDYLFKPINPQELLDLITGSPERSPVTQRSVHSPKAPLSIPLKILLAEDAPENQFVIKAYLKTKPYTIDIAQNGQIALDLFTAGSYDLVLMDIQMPVMDGYTATRAIRNWEHKSQKEPTPIIALTAHAFESVRQACLDAGCTGYLSKPVKKDRLLETITSVVHPQLPLDNQIKSPIFFT
ncbi:MAG: response regulator [Desulfotignum sp.]|nr:response regulator [Desulfotignum sp.]